MAMSQAAHIGLWMYRDSGGDVIQAELKRRLENADIRVTNDFDMRHCTVFNGSVQTNAGVDLSYLDVLFHMNADEQTPYQIQVLRALETSGVRLLNSFTAFDHASDKFFANSILRKSGLPVPPSALLGHDTSNEKIKNLFGAWNSVVVKPRYSFGGRGIIKFDHADQFIDFFHATKSFYPDYYVEKFLPFLDHDYRVEVLDDQVIGGYSRGLSHAFKTNISASEKKANARWLGLAPKDLHQHLAIRAAKILGLSATIVDMIECQEDGQTYILEVNCMMGIFVEAANKEMGIVPETSNPYQFASDEQKLSSLTNYLIRQVKS